MNENNISDVIAALNDTITDRRINPAEGSYTCYLFEKGLDKILKKVGEECSETIIAAKNSAANGNDELKNEVADLTYHLLVMMQCCDLSIDEVADVLAERAKKQGNLKTFKTVDKNS